MSIQPFRTVPKVMSCPGGVTHTAFEEVVDVVLRTTLVMDADGNQLEFGDTQDRQIIRRFGHPVCSVCGREAITSFRI